MESNLRSVTKGVTWRVIATLDTILLAYLFTGDVSTAFTIGGLEILTKTVLYYVHERLWLRLPVVFPLLWTEEDPDTIMRRHVGLIKAVTWRVFGAADTILLSFLVTGDLGASISIGGLEVITKIFLYYFHDRAWEKVSWGRKWSRTQYRKVRLSR